NGGPGPGAPQPGFVDTLRTLEDAVRGFEISAPHGAFWRNVDRDEFVDGLRINPGAAASSVVVQRIILPPDHPRHMPKYRPSVPVPRNDRIRQWIDAGAPDD